MNIAEYGPIVPIIVTAIVAAALSIFSLLVAQRIGMTPVQEKYVETLEGLNVAFQKRVDVLNSELADVKARLGAVEAARDKDQIVIQELKAENAELKQENFEIRQELALAKRRRISTRQRPMDQ